jgi:uncharacterized protein (DUF924 family)
MNYQEVLDFWFGLEGDREYGKPRSQWFTPNSEFDQHLRLNFLPHYHLAAARELDSWRQEPRSCLALIILLDQFPRNAFRGTPQAFATDSLALEVADGAIEQGFDQQLLPVQRWFVYLPLEHDENLVNQERSVQLFATLKDHPDSSEPYQSEPYQYALRHRDVIAKFGRFPHRNEILARESTPEEIEFLQQPGSSF